MARIKDVTKYPYDIVPELSDFLPGSDTAQGRVTKSYTIEAVFGLLPGLGYFLDAPKDGQPYIRQNGEWEILPTGSSPGGDVFSVFGRTGAVGALASDYAAFYSALGHTHTESDITDLGAYLESVDISDINATGTPGSSTYLRGDGVWGALPSAPVDSVFGRTGAVTAQESDYSTFFYTKAQADSAFAADSHTHLAADITDLSTFLSTYTGFDSRYYTETEADALFAADSHTHLEADITDLGAYLESVDISDINATGTPNSSAYLRGDGTWANLTLLQLDDFSVGTPASPSGSGSIAYDNTTGVFTFTPPDLSPYALDSAVVKLTGNQNIGGNKTFTSSVVIDSGNLSVSSGTLSVGSTGVFGSNLSAAGISITGGFDLEIDSTNSTTNTSGDSGVGKIGFDGDGGLRLIFDTAKGNTGNISLLNTNVTDLRKLEFPNASGTIALTSDISAEVNDLTAAVTWANIPDANVPETAVTQHEAALTITESQISDLQSYLTAEVNDLTAAVTWANIPDANVPETAVTQHEAALTITESQISDLQSYLTSVSISDINASGTADATTFLRGDGSWQVVSATETNDLTAAVTWANIPDANVPETAVTQHEAALTITESQISDLGTYAADSDVVKLTGNQTVAGEKTFTDLLKINRNAAGIEFNEADESTDPWYIFVDGDTFSVRRGTGTKLLSIDNSGVLRAGSVMGDVIWHAGNDGATSGLDADLLDGNHASAFYRSNTFNGGGTGTIQLNDGFSFIVGTSSDAQFKHSGGHNLLDLISGDFIIRDSTTNRFTFGRTTGDFSATGDVSATSFTRGFTSIASNGDIITSRDGVAELEILALNTLGGIIGTNTNHDLLIRRNNATKLTLGLGLATFVDDVKINGNALEIEGPSPRVVFTDTTTGHDDWVLIADGDNIDFRTPTVGSTPPKFRIYTSGNTEQTGTANATNFILSSDKRLKQNIEPLSTSIPVGWKKFELKSAPNDTRYGVIAQELEQIAPELVQTDKQGIKSVKYVDLLVAKVAELESENKELRHRMFNLEDEIERIKDYIGKQQ